MSRRRYVTRSYPSERRLVLAALRAGRRQAPIHGLLELDVTDARLRLSQMEPPGSFTAFVVASVARAVARHPEVAAHRDWWGRLVVHEAVDVATLVEITRPSGTFPFAHVLRGAAQRTVAELTAELHGVREGTALGGGADTAMLVRLGARAARVPGWSTLLYWVLARSPRARALAGTVSVTSVGMFGGGGGTGIGMPTIMTLTVLVGGIESRLRRIDGEIVDRDILDLTVTVDHRIVDGGPAARFVADLRQAIEQASVLA